MYNPSTSGVTDPLSSASAALMHGGSALPATNPKFSKNSSAYLARKTPAHARNQECLEENLELVRCHYNFLRPHRGLRFGTELRTPAMQAGLTARALTFREIFLKATPVSRASATIKSLEVQIGRALRIAA